MPEPAKEFLPIYTFIDTFIYYAYGSLRLSLEFVVSNVPLVLASISNLHDRSGALHTVVCRAASELLS